jgi:hypothetical protein
MNPEVEIVGGADELHTAAVIAAVQAIFDEEERLVREARRVSDWNRIDFEEPVDLLPDAWVSPLPDEPPAPPLPPA